MSRSNEEVVRRFLALWATRDIQAMVECFAEDCVYDNVPDKKPMVGRAALRHWLEMVHQHITNIEVEILHMASAGDWVLCERIDDHIHGEHHMPLPVMGAIQVVDGRIKVLRDYYCRQTVKELFGAVGAG